MKKLLQMKFMLLLCALIVGSGTAWADDELYYTLDGTKTDTGGNSNYAQAGNDVTQNSMNWSVTANCTQSPWRIGGKNLSEVDREVYSKTAMASAITKVELEIGSITLQKVNSIKFIVASDANFETTLDEQTVSTVEANSTITFVPTSGSEWTTGAYYKFVFNVDAGSSNSYIQLKSAKFYNAGATFSPLDHITLSGDNYPTTFYVGDTFSHEGMTVTATYVNETTKDVTTGATFSGYDMSTAGVQTVTVSYTQGEGDNAITKSATYNITVKGLSSVRLDGQYPLTFTEGDAFSHEGMTVYAVYTDGTNGSEEDVTSDAVFSEPDMTTVGNQNVTVSYTKNNVTKSTEYEITINALPTHNVTWSVNGTVTEPVSYKEGAAITFPANPADIEGKSFVGWTTAAIEGTTNTAPDFVTSATMGETDITFYAVFANAEGGAASLVEMASTDTFADGDNVVVVANDGEKDYAIYQETVSTSWVKKYEFDGNVTTVAADEKNWLTVTKNGETWKLGDSTNGYLYSSSSNNLSVNTGSSSSFTLGYLDNNGFTLKTGGRWLSLRTDTENNTFRLGGNGSTPLGVAYFRIFKYTEGGFVYTDYCTTVVADTRDDAEISFANPTATVEWYNAAQYTGQALTNPHSVSPITWTSSNEGVATVENGTVTVLALGETTIKASFDGDNNYKKGEASYVLTVQDSRTALELSFDPESVEVNVNATVAIPTLSGNLGNGAVTYASGDETIATVTEDANTSLVVKGLAEGTTTITATVAATNEYKEGTATFTVTVIDPNKKGSVNNPYTVDEARAAIDAGTGVTDVYATGIVSKIVTAFNSQYGNITYNISADGLTTSDQLQAYRGKSYNGNNFTSADDIKVGDVVVIYGTLKKYGSTYEFGEGNQLVSLERPSVPAIIVADPTINVDASSQGITRGITIENLTISDMSDFDIQYYDAVGEEVEKPSWIEEATVTVENSAYVLSCTVAANDVEARTAYLKVYAMNGDETIYSNLVTITQAQYVPDYATLPFTFNDGRADIEETNGLTQDGLGTDYNTSPKLKFDGTGDYVILKINEVPGTLTFDIKGNTFSDGTFKVQTSADGINYTDLQTYTELGSTQSEEFDIAANVRYIKWIYTKKVNGNVALGNISLGNTSMAVTIAAACTDGKGKYYGTFSSSSAFEVPENLTVSEIGIDDEGKMNVQNYESGAVVPANTGVMVSATTSGNFKLIKSSEAGTSILDEANALRPTGDGGITAEGMVAEPVVCKYYRLTMHDGTKLGFWWGNENGTSFAVGSNKAYMAVPAGQAAREGFAFDDDSTTGISNVNVNENVNGSVFDLQGRKVSTPGKGLYIVNGKKVVIK